MPLRSLLLRLVLLLFQGCRQLFEKVVSMRLDGPNFVVVVLVFAASSLRLQFDVV